MPTLSIGLAVHNGEAYLDETIRSLRRQTLRELEIIIVDNGSTDGTGSICRRHADEDPRITYERSETNRGAAWSHNRCFRRAGSPLFKWSAHDDLVKESFARRCVEALTQRPDAVLAHPRTTLIDAAGATIEDLELPWRTDDPRPHRRFRSVLYRRRCYPLFGVIRREALESTALFGGYSGSDKVLLAELAFRGPFVQLPEHLLSYRVHPTQSVSLLPDRYRYTLWFDPTPRGRILLPEWRLWWEHHRLFRRAGLTAWQRFLCYLYLMPLLTLYAPKLVRDVVAAPFRARRYRRGAS